MMPCEHDGPPPVDVTRDVFDLAAVVLSAGGAPEEYQRILDQLLRTPRESLQGLAAVLLSVARPDALADVRHMGVMHQLRDVEAVR
jgi:hypothetical protein